MRAVLRMGFLGSLVAGIYVVVVPIFGAPGVVAAGLVAAGFGWLDRAAEVLVRRTLREEAVDPLAVLGRFVRPNPSQFEHMARVVGEATNASEVVVRLRLHDELVQIGSWAAFHEPLSAGPRQRSLPEVFPVWDGPRLLGAIEVDLSEPLTPKEQGLLGDLAAQARLVLRNEQLTAELQRRAHELETRAGELAASRRRVVAAQDAERFDLERAVHDGSQQRLVGLAMRIGLARSLVEREPDRASVVMDDALRLTSAARETLDALARGLYPPALLDEGVAAALREELSTLTSVAWTVTGSLPRSLPIEIQAAVYFACLEAVQNALKHGAPRTVAVTLRDSGVGLEFAVADDGSGFDPGSGAGEGSGLRGMTDRLAAFGGTLSVAGRVGGGAIVSGSIRLSS